MSIFTEDTKPQIRELTLKNGISYPSDVELIMLILGSGIKSKPVEELSMEVLKVVLNTNHENMVDELLKINGIGTNKALAIAASLELGYRLNRKPQMTLEKPADIIPYVQSYAMQPSEHFLCLSFNGSKELLSIRVICIGSNNMAIMRPADVFNQAVLEHASAVVVCHNHPGGNPNPSESDLRTTQKLCLASELLGITLLDHIIITKTSYFSFLEHGILEKISKNDVVA